MKENKKDSLGERIKEYENVSRIKLPRRIYTMIRIDGKAFHTYTKGLNRPFDNGFIEDMDATAAYLCKNIQGAKLAFVQSDEISILLTDFETITTDAWFDGNIQKMASISASMATAKFNQLRLLRKAIGGGFDANQILQGGGSIGVNEIENFKLAEFDSRVFQIPQAVEVENYLIWRQNDTTRNSIQSVAQSMFSHSELENKNCDQLQEMCFQKGVNWNDFDPKLKRGRMIIKENFECKEVISDDDKTIPSYNRTKWISIAPPIFTQDRNFLDKLIPKND